jgi:hypothetical protein
MSDKVTIEIDAKWVRRVKSPFYWAISALTGVSITFAPLFLYRYGQNGSETWKVLICFAVIYLVPLFYIDLAHEVITSIYRQTAAPLVPRERKLPKIMGAIGRFIGRVRGK